ncbi:MAG: hypothetical protein NZ700_16840 [Gemmataceae bacterium]|nr:hypothetical protein [Gemmataceae bacterium]MDW8266438.1 hypothetical protein [Gemmataceae bacterium]
MHSSYRVPRTRVGSLILIGCLWAGAASAQDPPPAPKPAAPGGAPPAGTDSGAPLGTPENPYSIIMPIATTQRLQMTTKKPIRQVFNQRDTIIQISALRDDPTTVLVTSQRVPGTSQVTLTDIDGHTEEYAINVQPAPAQTFDIELMRKLIRQAVPTSNVIPVLGGGSSIILTGTVAHAEDIPIILQVANAIIRAGPIDPVSQAALQAVGAGASAGVGVGGVSNNITGAGVAELTSINIINAMRVGGEQQVQLDVIVARVARNELRRLGFNWLYSDKVTIFGNTTGGVTTLQLTPVGVGSAFLAPNGVVAAPPEPGNANLFLGLLYPNSGFLPFLRALRDEGLVKLLAEPKLVTLSGRPARFLSGGQQAVPNVSGLGGIAGVQFVPFGTELQFLPIVLGNGKIYLEVNPSISTLDQAAGTVINGAPVPGRIEQTVRTSVLMEDGQTFVIGGLIQHRVEGFTTKVPVLGDVPFLGALFSNKQFNDVEEELIVMVTPRVVDPMDCSQLPKLLPGQETRNPDDFELFLEGILEAPRGSRRVCQGHKYVPAYLNSPNVNQYPCQGPGGIGACGRREGCPAGACPGSGGAVSIVPATPVPPSSPSGPMLAPATLPPPGSGPN